MNTLSIIIISFNTEQLLHDCLLSIYDLLSDGKDEIIVVDNGSSDGTRAMLKKEFPRIQTILNDTNLGFGAANNQGMRMAKGEYILLLNSDTVVSSSAVEKCRQYMVSHLEVGILGCRMNRPSGNPQRSYGKFYGLRHAIVGGLESNTILSKIMGKIPFFGHASLEVNDEAREVDWVSGAYMFLRREVFESTAGFDEKIFLYGEEVEWCYRVKKLGWKIVFFPLAQIIHVGQASVSSTTIIERNRHIIWGRNYFLSKHYGNNITLLFDILAFFSALIKLPVLLILHFASRRSKRTERQIKFQMDVIKFYRGSDK